MDFISLLVIATILQMAALILIRRWFYNQEKLIISILFIGVFFSGLFTQYFWNPQSLFPIIPILSLICAMIIVFGLDVLLGAGD